MHYLNILCPLYISSSVARDLNISKQDTLIYVPFPGFVQVSTRSLLNNDLAGRAQYGSIHTDGVWWNWANSVCTNRRLQPAHDLPARIQALLPNEFVFPYYVKHSNGRYAAQPSSGAFARNNAPGQPAGQPSAGGGAGPSAASLQILPQTTYRRGATPEVDQCLAPFNVSMSAAEWGQVPDLDVHAFIGELAVQEKATIRFGFPYVESLEYKPKRHSLQRYGAPIARGQLAMVIAEEVRRVVDALAEIGRPLTLPSGRRVAFEDLVLVDIRRVSRGSLQPTLAVRGA